MIEFLVNRRLILILSLFFIGLLSLLACLLLQPSDLITAKLQLTSLSKGEQYIGRLRLWNILAVNGDWTTASKIATYLDPVDLEYYQSKLDPTNLKKQLNQLIAKTEKNADDWLEITRINLIIGKTDQAKESITRAYHLDPIRDDISKLFYEIYKN